MKDVRRNNSKLENIRRGKESGDVKKHEEKIRIQQEEVEKEITEERVRQVEDKIEEINKTEGIQNEIEQER